MIHKYPAFLLVCFHDSRIYEPRILGYAGSDIAAVCLWKVEHNINDAF